MELLEQSWKWLSGNQEKQRNLGKLNEHGTKPHPD